MQGSMFKTLTLAAALALAPVGVQRAALLFVRRLRRHRGAGRPCSRTSSRNARQAGRGRRVQDAHTEKLEMHATGEKGFEYFFDATVKFPRAPISNASPRATNSRKAVGQQALRDLAARLRPRASNMSSRARRSCSTRNIASTRPARAGKAGRQ